MYVINLKNFVEREQFTGLLEASNHLCGMIAQCWPPVDYASRTPETQIGELSVHRCALSDTITKNHAASGSCLRRNLSYVLS